MTRQASVPFHLRRGQDEFRGGSVTSTTEVVHGLLRLDGDRLVVQWRLARRTEHMGAMDVRSDEELEAVRELVVPLAGVAGAAVRRRRWAPWKGPSLVLRAADLRAFEEVAGEGGLKLDHPAELLLGLRRADVLLAEEFAAEVVLAVAERAVGEMGDVPRLPPTALDP
ncbi:MAG TPA: hypothetical protein VLH75_03310 [Longimicrobiales bacterium]|nr:hypothetical protein [Longimicrobiales bacterium]